MFFLVTMNKTIILKVNKSRRVKISLLYLVIDTFLPNVPILYLLKTFFFSDALRGCKMGIWGKEWIKQNSISLRLQ